MSLQQTLWIRQGKNKRPYFLHKINKNKQELITEAKKKYGKTKYFFVKLYNAKKKQEEYALYLNRIVHYEQ